MVATHAVAATATEENQSAVELGAADPGGQTRVPRPERLVFRDAARLVFRDAAPRSTVTATC